MANGDLRTYLGANKPSQQLQLSWFRDMARTLEYFHDQRVLVADIASRNFLLDLDLNIKFCDFSEASLLSLDDNGYTTRIDIGFLGAVIYEVVTGEKCEIDLFKDIEQGGHGENSFPALRMFGLVQSLKAAGWMEDFKMLVVCYRNWSQLP